MSRLTHSTSTSGRILGVVLLAVLVLGLGGTILLQIEKQPESSPVSRGAKLAESAGCFACHGRGDGEKRFNLRQREEKWVTKNNPNLWEGDITKVDELVVAKLRKATPGAIFERSSAVRLPSPQRGEGLGLRGQGTPQRFPNRARRALPDAERQAHSFTAW
jgi:hypothetical protein